MTLWTIRERLEARRPPKRFCLKQTIYSCRISIRRALLFAGLQAGLCAGPAAAVEIFAHRGGSALFPENTCAAIRSCAGRADGVEFDVRATADGELVLMHDETVDRTTDGSGAVAELTLAQLKTLDAGSKFSPAFAGERIPTLVEALRARPPGIPALIDCKMGPDSAAALATTVRNENAVSNVIVIHGSYVGFLGALRAIDPRIALGALGSNLHIHGSLSPGALAFFRKMGISTIYWAPQDVDREVVDRVHSYGMRIGITVPTSECRTFVDMGVDMLIVDDPQAAKEAIRWTPSSLSNLAFPDPPSGGTPQPITAEISVPSEQIQPDRVNNRTGLASARIAQDVVAYWKLDDGLADPYTVNAEDVAERSRGRLAGFSGAPGWVSGSEAIAGGALRLDGIDDYVRIPPNEFLDIGAHAVSISLWVKLSALPSGLSNAYAFIYGSDLASYMLYLDRDNRELRFKVTDASLQSASPGIPEADLRLGIWHHVVGVYDGAAQPAAGQARIYLDGQLKNTHVGADASPGRNLTGPVRPGQFASIGRQGDVDGFYFAGIVDDIALWRRPLAADEILHIHALGQENLPLDGRPGGR